MPLLSCCQLADFVRRRCRYIPGLLGLLWKDDKEKVTTVELSKVTRSFLLALFEVKNGVR